MESKLEPYRVFFPLGALTAVLGTALWVAFGFGALSTYPGISHPELMIGGFIFAFASGFLMTAVPQFTGSRGCSRAELALMVALFVALLSVAFSSNRFFFHLLSLASLVYLIGFCGRRFVTKTSDPPRFFLFVGLGLAMGVLGALGLALSDLGQLTGAWTALARLIYLQGMVLSLILGVGSQLLPAIWGWSELRDDLFGVPLVAPVAALALVLTSSFALQASGHERLGRLVCAALVTALALAKWKIHRKPKTRGRLAFWLWIAAWSLLIGLWISVALPLYWLAGLHVAFVGGFGLMTFMVASRVTLAHGGHGVRVELRSRGLTAAALLICMAALTRFAAPFVPKIYLHHLAYAAIIWILGVAVWAWVFIPRLVVVHE